MGPCFGALRLHVAHLAFGLAAVMTVDVPRNPVHPSSNVAAIRFIMPFSAPLVSLWRCSTHQDIERRSGTPSDLQAICHSQAALAR